MESAQQRRYLAGEDMEILNWLMWVDYGSQQADYMHREATARNWPMVSRLF
jgi:hypothetical protein